MYSLPEALPHSRIGPSSIPLGNCTYILDSRVVKGPLVRWGYIFGWRKDSEAESYKEKGGENLPNLYTTSVPPGAYNAYKRIRSNWIWI
jgi:hypothetical protein